MLEALKHAHRRNSLAVLSCVAAAVALTMGPASAANDETRQVLVGDVIIIELDGNSTTGYRWELDDTASEDANFVKVEDLGYVKRELKPGERPLLGAPSKYQFQVTGLKAGTAKLTFRYVKDSATPPGKTEEIHVEVIGN